MAANGARKSADIPDDIPVGELKELIEQQECEKQSEEERRRLRSEQAATREDLLGMIVVCAVKLQNVDDSYKPLKADRTPSPF